MKEIKKQWWHNFLHKDDKDLPWLKFKYLCNFMENKTWKVLEIWCWSWKNLLSLHDYNSDLLLCWVDIDNNAILEAKKHCGDFIYFSCSPWEKTIFADKSFDYIVISDYLEHVDNAHTAIHEIYRILKPWWYIHAFVPCEWEKFSIYRIFKKIFGFNVKKTWWHVQFFKKIDVEKYFLHEWFQIVDKKYSYHMLWKFMDFLLFALLLNKKMAKLRRESNKYYNNEKKIKSSFVTIIFNSILSFANYLAYKESSRLKNVRFGAAGIHLVIKKS
jgi:SAM-dependent methyltransferase